MKIRKDDIVLLPDNSEGRVLEKVTTESVAVYKIRKGESVSYFDESKVRLKKRPPLNRLLSILHL